MAENESPAREPSTRGRGRGGRGRGGRGRGGGRGGSTTALSKAATAKAGRGGSRRGRAKNFSDSRVQAAYERQRHLKANYQAVAHALKPALQELAERTIDDALQNPDKYKYAEAFMPVMRQLQRNLDAKLAEHKRRYDKDIELAEHLHHADNYVAEQEFKNGLEEIEEQFHQSQENRARILNSLYDKDLPVDVVDEQYEYKIITDDHFDHEFGIYECYKDGSLVPYPSRVPGTPMWQKARDNEAAAVAAVAAAAAAPAKGRGRGRGANKRRAQEQPEGQPTPKKNTRSNAEDAVASPSLAAPAPAKGLLASAAEVEATPEGTPAESDSTPASPEPPAFVNGITPAAVARVQSLKLPAREKSPPLPKNISDRDEHGFRIYNQRPSLREKGINSRLFVPRPFEFESWEIGFRDTTNDSSKGHTRAKRGKYLDTPNSNGLHIDHWCNGYDYSATTPEDFDKELVKRFSVHPKYGVILPGAPAVKAEKTPHVMPGKPVVYIANPSGRISHASRSFLKTTNHRRSEDNPWRTKIGASMRRFCKLDEINPDDISISEYVRPEEELRSKSLGTAIMELEARPVVSRAPSESEEPDVEEQEDEQEEVTANQPETGFTDLSVLAYAGAFIEAQEAPKAPKPAPKPARYDAIRDVFTDSKPAPAPQPDTSSSVGLDVLAALSNVVSTSNEPAPIQDIVQVYDAAAIPEHAMSYEPAPVAEAPPMLEPISVQEQPAYRDAAANGMGSAPVSSHGMHERDPRSSVSQTNELPPVTPSQAPIDPRYNPNPVEVPQGYMHQPRAQLPMQPSGLVHGHSGEAMPYPPMHEHAVPQHPSVRHSDYPPPPPSQGPPVQDQGAYLSHNSYPTPDHRDAHMAAGRPIDPGYPPRRMSGYSAEVPSYSRAYWSQPPPLGPPPPGPPTGAPGPPGPAPGPASSHYSSPAPPPARIPFSHNGSAEPLPPLRPSRGRNQSLQDETLLEPSLRSSGHSSMGGSFYPPGPPPPRNYHRGYPGPEPHGPPPLQPIATDRILPNPQTAGSGYMTSPHQGYAHQVLSPTYANPPPMPPHMAQSPQDNPQGLPNSVHRHRSTPSGSSDASNKYRKLQPAPVPAHRAWPNKPELKTIPYDHKETGSAAALPSSGPTQIRGWSNGDNSSSKADEQPKPKSAFKSVRFAEPLVGLPPAGPKSNKRKDIDSDSNGDVVGLGSSVVKRAKTNNSVVPKKEVIVIQDDSSHKRRLRPRKPKTTEAELTAPSVEPAKKQQPKVAQSRKRKTVEAEPAPKVKRIKIVRSGASKNADTQATRSTPKNGKSPKNEESSVKDESSDDLQIIMCQPATINIESTDEGST
ncbi:hypothetical protein NW762_005153 [Fusarium torreyae]|uniref:Uncharacterized protein n=1 Tax=Fusarium torreyae TaxID=1237075 RepID=A0A9W8S469_9HYPO|nr:hypothetical protein NW762_005153 [Fusarium torreyae]